MAMPRLLPISFALAAVVAVAMTVPRLRQPESTPPAPSVVSEFHRASVSGGPARLLLRAHRQLAEPDGSLRMLHARHGTVTP
jgi:hypothetical protein